MSVEAELKFQCCAPETVLPCEDPPDGRAPRQPRSEQDLVTDLFRYGQAQAEAPTDLP